MDRPSSRWFQTLGATALTLAALLSASTAHAQIADPAAAASELFTLINQERAKDGKPALTRQCDLDAAAQRHVNDMIAKNFGNHIGSDGSDPGKRIAATGYPSSSWGENIYFSSSPANQGAINFWLGSAGHRANLLSAAFKEVGVAVGYGPNTNYKNYWTVVFTDGKGRQCPPTTTPSTPTLLFDAISRLEGGVISAPAAARDPRDGRIRVFARGTDGAIWYRRRAPGGKWEGWQSLQGGLKGAPAVVHPKGGNPYVFARGNDDAIWLRFGIREVNAATGAESETFSNWGSLGGIVRSDPVVGLNVDGRAEVFVRGTDNALWHNWQLDNGEFGGWVSLGGVLVGGIAAGLNADGRLSAFHVGNGGLWVRTQLGRGSSSDWGAWTQIGGRPVGDPALTKLSDGRLVVVYRAPDNTVVARWQNAPNATSWSGDAALGSPSGGAAGNPTAVLAKNGRLQVYVRTAQNLLFRRTALTADPSAAWSDWTKLDFPSLSQDPVAIRQDTAGTPSVFAVDGGRALWELVPPQ